ncbi:hypothetical protein [Microbacterium sp. S1037]|uniref:hypothetical protein n=1 Tax=Microbacterium sp. S1037 TaxID=3398227 RepID=UPI003AAE05BF
MANSTVLPSAVPQYGFNIYKDGVRVREQIVEATSAAFAEVSVWRYLRPDEYPWYSVPRLVGADEECP